MAEIKIVIPEKIAKEFLIDSLDELLHFKKKEDYELVFDLIEDKETVKKKKNVTYHDGKKKIEKKGDGLLIKGKLSEILLNKNDIEKIRKLI